MTTQLTPAPFIGREAELDELTRHVEAGAQGAGGTVLVEGAAGMGKRLLLDRLQERVGKAGKELEDGRFVQVHCSELTSSDGWAPFGEVLQSFVEDEKRKDHRERLLRILKEQGPELLNLVPMVGPGLSAAAKAGVSWFDRSEGGGALPLEDELLLKFETAIFETAEHYRPLVLVIHNGQWISPSAARVLVRLAQRAPKARLVVLVSHLPVDRTHVLNRELLRNAKDVIRRMTLSGFSEEEVRRYVDGRYGGLPDPNLPSWLAQLSDVTPLFVSQTLDLLEQRGIVRERDGGWILDGRLTSANGEWTLVTAEGDDLAPGGVEDVLEERLADLGEAAHKLLEAGAVQGPQFLSCVVASLCRQGTNDVVHALNELEQAYRMVSFANVERSLPADAFLYKFRPTALRGLLYEKLNVPMRLMYHRAVAESLEELLKEDETPPRKWLVESARHYEAASRPFEAARDYSRAAESCLADGAYDEARMLAEQAVAVALPWMTTGPEQEALRARAIQLLLLSLEDVWGGSEAPAERLLALGDEAEEAAARTADPVLRAQVKYVRGRLLVALDGLDRGLEVLEEASDLAERAGDKVGQLVTMTELGLHQDSADLAKGHDVLRRAYALYESGEVKHKDWLEARRLERYAASLKTNLGVASYDLGEYGEAYDLLQHGGDALRSLGYPEDAAWADSFLAQLQTATGAFEDAKRTLDAGLESLADRKASRVRAYLRALLGRLHLECEPPDLDGAADALALAWKETQDVPHAGVVPLVRIHLAEVSLARTNATDQELAEADRLLETAVSESDATGWHRSVVGGLMVRSRLALRCQRPEDAAAFSTLAVERLSARGDVVPVFHTEDVWFAHARALHAVDRRAEAADFLARAKELVEKKAVSLDAARREAFSTRVRASREILAEAF